MNKEELTSKLKEYFYGVESCDTIDLREELDAAGIDINGIWVKISEMIMEAADKHCQ